MTQRAQPLTTGRTARSGYLILLLAILAAPACFTKPHVPPAPRGQNWALKSQGYRQEEAYSQSTTETQTQYSASAGRYGAATAYGTGYGSSPRTVTKQTVVHVYVESSENVKSDKDGEMPRARRSLQVGANVDDYEFNGQLR